MIDEEKILEENGWEVECESPFEIRHEESGSFATLMAADAVVDDLVHTKKLSDLATIKDAYQLDLIDKDKFIEQVIERLNNYE